MFYGISFFIWSILEDVKGNKINGHKNDTNQFFGNNPYYCIDGDQLIILRKRSLQSDKIAAIPIATIQKITYLPKCFYLLPRLLRFILIFIIQIFIVITSLDFPESFSARILINYTIDGEKAATEFDAHFNKEDWRGLKTLLSQYPIEIVREGHF